MSKTYPCERCNMDDGSPVCLQDNRCPARQAAAQALRTTSQPGGVPEGWSIERGADGSSIKLREPGGGYFRFHDDGEHERNGLVWMFLNALLTAAPTPPAAPQKVMAWAHPDGRVVPSETMESARRDGGAMASSLAGYTIALGPIAAPESVPTRPANSQNWAGMDGAIAWHLIERHADNWADVGLMMGEWLKANRSAAPPAAGDEAKPFEVRIAGPDDVIQFADELSAHRHANAVNKIHVADCLKNPSADAYVMCVATVHEAEAGKVGG